MLWQDELNAINRIDQPIPVTGNLMLTLAVESGRGNRAGDGEKN